MKKLLSVLLCGLLLFGAVAAAFAVDPDHDCPAAEYTDVDLNAWYHADLDYVLEHGYLKGVGEGRFAPEAPLTRAMAVTVLWRLAGNPDAPLSGFLDLKPESWYVQAVSWAASEGIAAGVSETAFAPDRPVTRQQLATFFYRYARQQGMDVSGGASLDAYQDQGDVRAWAEDALRWAVDRGIVRGVSADRLSPDGTATRVQFAAMLHRFCLLSEPAEPDDPTDPTDPTDPPEPETPTLPIFYIDTENGAPIVSKEEYIAGTLTITNADAAYCLNAAPLQIRGRGNYSWTSTEKKSYRIKLESKVNLLGQGKGKAKSWTLLAVHCDKSLLRTEAAFYFASKLGNLPFVSSSSFVELYLNGQYDGVYEVCDQIQVNSARVDIDDSGDQPDIGYLVELDRNASEDVIRISNGDTFEIKSEYVNDAQKAFITDYLSRCIEAIESGDRAAVEELIDLPSAVDAYLVEEYMKNLDVGWGSFYFTKPAGDKLYFGPVWDFDLCAGNAEDDYYDPAFKSWKYTYVGNPYFWYAQQSNWFLGLRECDWFNEMVAARWNEVKGIAAETATHVETLAKTYQSSFERNFERWPIFGTKINREPEEVLQIHSFMGQVRYLKLWLTNRASWLTKFYSGKVSDIS